VCVYIAYCTARALQVGARVRYTKVPDGARAKAQDVVQAIAHRRCMRWCTCLACTRLAHGLHTACTRLAHGMHTAYALRFS